MSRFAGLKTQLEPKPTSAVPTQIPPGVNVGRAKAREGKKAVVGYFSAELSRAMRRLALDEGSSVQALLGEAVDLLMRDRGKHPFGER